MQIDPEDFKRHYALLSDDALLEMDRGDLIDAARVYYDAELAQRKLMRPHEAPHDASKSPMKPKSADEGAVVASFQYPDQLADARDLLENAAIPYSIQLNRFHYELVVPPVFREQAEQKLRGQFLDPEAEMDYQHHFEELSNDELLALNTEGLGEPARRMLGEELERRDLKASAQPVESQDQTEGNFRLVGEFPSLEEANLAQALLYSANISCSVENEHSKAWSGEGEVQLMVPAADYERACEILEAELTEEDLIAQAEADAQKESAKDAQP